MLSLLVFFSGALLMALELLGSRLLAPDFGTGIIVWGSLIGLFMGALAVGYWLGGLAADRYPRMRLLGGVLLAAGLLVWVIPSLKPAAVALAGTGPRSGPLLATAILFFLPTSLMGMVSPIGIRLQGTAQGLGRSAGRLYAISTTGSVVGTLLTAFYLVPLAGVVQLVQFVGLALATLGGVALAWELPKAQRFIAVAAAGVLWGAVYVGGPSRTASVEPGYFGEPATVLYQKDSLYHHIRVTESRDNRYLRFDRSWQSAMSLTDPTRSAFTYTDYFHLAFAIRSEVKDVLIIGLGGGTMVKQLRRDYPGIHIDVAELDPEVVAVARQYFAVPEDDERLRTHVMDGRRFLESDQNRYDLIIVDAFTGDQIPFHLTTREFLAVAKGRLKPDGLFAANLISAVSGERGRLFAAYYRTVSELFPERYLFASQWQERPDPNRVRNLILYAGSGGQLNPDVLVGSIVSEKAGKIATEFRPRVRDIVRERPVVTDAPVLTDDYAPVEDLFRFDHE